MTTPTIAEQLATLAKAAGTEMTVNDYACAASAMLFVVNRFAAFNAWNEASTNRTMPLNRMLIALARIDHIFQGIDRADQE